jgi:hypothetical protein
MCTLSPLRTLRWLCCVLAAPISFNVRRKHYKDLFSSVDLITERDWVNT